VSEPVGSAAVSEAERERHATNLELFLDLVFVFAVTQIASLISHHPSADGTAHGLLMAMLVWWQWSQFTWTGSAVDLQGETRTRVLVLCLIPVTLIMTISIPDAFHTTGMWFASAYLGVQLLMLAAQGMYSMSDPVSRNAYVRWASLASVAPAIVFIGAFTHGSTRVALWAAAAAIDFIGSLRAGGGEWAIDPVHFAERHALFVIIALGEVLVAAGASASDVGLTRHVAVALVVSVAVACTAWWTYFAFIPEAGERALRRATGSARGHLARNMYTWGHFPLVFGIILYAVVVKHLIPEPLGHLSTDDRWLLACSVAAFVSGLLIAQFNAVRRLAPERLAAIPVAAALCALGRWLPGTVVVGSVAVLYAVMQTITLRTIRRRSTT
jgi:low temperature requirement protein LtrA